MTNFLLCEKFPQSRELNSPSCGTGSQSSAQSPLSGELVPPPRAASSPLCALNPLTGGKSSLLGGMNFPTIGTRPPGKRQIRLHKDNTGRTAGSFTKPRIFFAGRVEAG